MTALNGEAKDELRWAGISQASWARRHFQDNRWFGDACGCPDDRCIGYHHGEADACWCLRSLLESPPCDPGTAITTVSHDASRRAVEGDRPCSCGRPAWRVFETERFGDVSWCGS